MWFDRFDIVMAHYIFCLDYHAGIQCPLYARQCRIRRYFTPSPMLGGYEDLSENAQVIYDNLVEKHGF